MKLYLSRPNTTVIATVRDVNSPSVADLHNFTIASGSRLIVSKIDSSSATDANTAINELKSKYEISKLDTVIANAGLGEDWDRIKDANTAQAEKYFQVNAAGPMHLFYATLPLLSAASTPRFVLISSVFGSIELQSNLQQPDVVYGMSKAAANFFARKVHFEFPDLIAFPLHPGYVKVDFREII